MSLSANDYKDQWEASYSRYENHIFYPSEEVVRFISTHVRRRIGPSKFRDVLHKRRQLRGIDYGCGIGRQAVLLEEFGIETYGLDLSEYAIAVAKKVAQRSGWPDVVKRLACLRSFPLSFTDNFFDVGICEGVLDSMHFETARSVVQELSRVVSNYLHVSLIALPKPYTKKQDEIIVETVHERGTVQSYYYPKKIEKLFNHTGWKMRSQILITETSLPQRTRNGRYYIVLAKQ